MVQIQTRKYVLDHADDAAPTGQQEANNTDQESNIIRPACQIGIVKSETEDVAGYMSPCRPKLCPPKMLHEFDTHIFRSH